MQCSTLKDPPHLVILPIRASRRPRTPLDETPQIPQPNGSIDSASAVSAQDWSRRDLQIAERRAEKERLENALAKVERELRQIRFCGDLKKGRIVWTQSPRRQGRVLSVEPCVVGFGIVVRVDLQGDEQEFDAAGIDCG